MTAASKKHLLINSAPGVFTRAKYINLCNLNTPSSYLINHANHKKCHKTTSSKPGKTRKEPFGQTIHSKLNTKKL